MASKSASIRPTRTGGSDHIFPTDDYRTTTDGAKQCSLLFSLGFLFALFITTPMAVALFLIAKMSLELAVSDPGK
jgi:hypothetical protein